jgi:hypothetical protein
LILIAGCARVQEAEKPTGSARIVVATQALTANDVARVDVSVEAFDIARSTIPLIRNGNQWEGVMSRIRAGTNRSFYAEAFDSNDVLIYKGEVTNVTVTPEQTINIMIVAQQVTPPDPFENENPLIDSVVVSKPLAEPGETLSLQVTAHDPNPGDTLTYSWVATAGSFSDPANPSTSWTAPSTQGDVTFVLTVSDSHGAIAALDFTITVAVVGYGDVGVEVQFNSWPTVTSVNATPGRVNVGQTILATVEANDPDNAPETLSYNWSSDCTGTWTNGTSRNARFTPTVQPAAQCGTANNCKLTVTVSDGHGGVTTGTLGVCVGSSVAPNFPPQIASVYQSTQTVVEGDNVRLRVNATDSQNRPMTFNWSVNVGTLGTPVVNSNGRTGEIIWTAPSCLKSGSSPSVTVRLYAASTPSLYAEHTFTLTWGATGRVCSGPDGDLCFDHETDYLGRWSFDTTFSDSSPGSNHLTQYPSPDPFISAGIWSDAAQTQGDYLAARATDDDELDFGTADFTIAMWLNLSDIGWPRDDVWILAKAPDNGYADGQGWSLRSFRGQLQWNVLGAQFNGPTLPASVWQHIAIVRQGNELKFYRNGQLTHTHTHSYTNAIAPTNAPFRVGSRGNGQSPMYGVIDELSILDRAATPLELASLYAKSCR